MITLAQFASVFHCVNKGLPEEGMVTLEACHHPLDGASERGNNKKPDDFPQESANDQVGQEAHVYVRLERG